MGYFLAQRLGKWDGQLRGLFCHITRLWYADSVPVGYVPQYVAPAIRERCQNWRLSLPEAWKDIDVAKSGVPRWYTEPCDFSCRRSKQPTE